MLGWKMNVFGAVLWEHKSKVNTLYILAFSTVHILASLAVGLFGGIIGCRLYRLGVFTIGQCLGLVSKVAQRVKYVEKQKEIKG